MTLRAVAALRACVLACVLAMALALSASAAVVDIVGFETADGTFTSGGASTGDGEWYTTITGTGSISTTTVRTGVDAFRANPTTSALGYVGLRGWSSTGAATSTIGQLLSARFYFRYATKPAANNEPMFSHAFPGAGAFELRINSSGNLLAYSNTTLLSTGATVLASGTWYRITYTSNGTNAWAVTLDGATELSGTDAFAGNTAFYFGKPANRNSQTVDFFYDDILTTDTYETLGAGQCVRLAPTGNGTYTAWTDGDGDATGNYTDVDDAPGDPAYDSLTSYSLSTTNLDAETVDVTDSGTAGITGTINAVKSITVHRVNNASATNIQHRLISNGTNYDLASAATTNGTWRVLASVRSVDPFDSAAFTTADIDGLQVGVEHNTATARELDFTMACVMVDFTPASGPSIPVLMDTYRRFRQ